jgi:hypothetical protein
MLDQVEAEASETVVHAEVCVDGRLLGDYLHLRRELQGESKSGPPGPDRVEELSSRFVDLHQKVNERTHTYTFRCMDRVERERLKDRHPPTQQQKKKMLEWNPATFEPALAAVTLVEIDGVPVDEPEGRLEEHFRRLWSSMPEGEHGWGVIGRALAEANYEGTQVPLSVRAIGDRFVSTLSLTMQQATG